MSGAGAVLRVKSFFSNNVVSMPVPASPNLRASFPCVLVKGKEGGRPGKEGTNLSSFGRASLGTKLDVAI